MFEFLSNNWVWILLIGGMVFMHLGHGADTEDTWARAVTSTREARFGPQMNTPLAIARPTRTSAGATAATERAASAARPGPPERLWVS